MKVKTRIGPLTEGVMSFQDFYCTFKSEEFHTSLSHAKIARFQVTPTPVCNLGERPSRRHG